MKNIALLVLPFIAAGTIRVAAQDAPKPPVETRQATPAAKQQVPLKVQLVLSRYSGEKKVSSVPYILSVVANDNDKTSLRMGLDVPMPANVFSGKDVVTSYSYKSIGTDIDCAAQTIDGGYFKLDLGVSDRSVSVPEKAPSGMSGVPIVRSFTSTFNILVKDGQTAQHTSATDPVSGEVLRVDVTVTVLK